MSGTTAITCFLSGSEICVANIGDSRAIIGEKRQTKNGERLVAYSLSIDQTPYRADERERVKKVGAEVMSCDQKDGVVPFHENWGINLGEDVDTGGDPPRVWERGQDYPGCAFTRSIGDAIAEDIGVFAEPELLSKELTRDDQFILIASDGIFEFITNQGAADIVSQYADPLEGARAIVAEAYRLWLQYEVRTDDITIIVLRLEWGPEEGLAPLGGASQPSTRKSAIMERRLSRLSANGNDLVNLGLDLGDGNRPVRRGLSKEKKSMIMSTQSAVAEDDFGDAEKVEPTPKTADELLRISAAVKTNFLFAHLNDAQRQELYLAMKRTEVKAGEVVIRQGDPGEWFYVVDSGVFTVTQRQRDGDKERDVHIFTYKNEGGVHHCFGELALMYSKPRAATVTAETDGVLWAMARSSFRRVLMKSSAQTLTKVLRSVDILRSLSTVQLQRLQDILTEVRFDDGAAVITQGDVGKEFYIIVEGAVVCTRQDGEEPPVELMRLKQYQYFGERALLHDAPRAATVTAVGPTKCLSVERRAFEEVLGPLQSIIDDDAKVRERQALVKQLETEAIGLTAASIDDFGVLAVVKHGDVSDLAVVVKPPTDAGGAPSYYTMRTLVKQKVVETSQMALVQREHELMGLMSISSPGVAVELLSMPGERALYAVLKPVIVTNLEAVMTAPMREETCRFYCASLTQALSALHDESIVYRNVNPEYLMLDSGGYVQLLDFRLAKQLHGKTFTTCGAPDYLVSRSAQQHTAARSGAAASCAVGCSHSCAPTQLLAPRSLLTLRCAAGSLRNAPRRSLRGSVAVLRRPRLSRARGTAWLRTTGRSVSSCTRCWWATRPSRARARWTCTPTSPTTASRRSYPAARSSGCTRLALLTSSSTTIQTKGSDPNVSDAAQRRGARPRMPARHGARARVGAACVRPGRGIPPWQLRLCAPRRKGGGCAFNPAVRLLRHPYTDARPCARVQAGWRTCRRTNSSRNSSGRLWGAGISR